MDLNFQVLCEDGDSFSFKFNNNNVDFYIDEPYLVSRQDWSKFYHSVKNNIEDDLYFGWCNISHDNGKIKLFCETRGGQGGEGRITYSLSSQYCLDAFHKAMNYHGLR